SSELPAEGTEHTRQRVDHQQVQADVDTRYFRRFRVTANGKNVLTETGFVPQHPDECHRNQRVESDVRETEAPQRNKALSKGREATVKTRNWRRPDKVVIERVDAVDDNHRAERGNEWRHVEISDNQAVDQTDHRANGTDNQNYQRNRHRRHFRE